MKVISTGLELTGFIPFAARHVAHRFLEFCFDGISEEKK